jgi:hypothetical protein
LLSLTCALVVCDPMFTRRRLVRNGRLSGVMPALVPAERHFIAYATCKGWNYRDRTWRRLSRSRWPGRAACSGSLSFRKVDERCEGLDQAQGQLTPIVGLMPLDEIRNR